MSAQLTTPLQEINAGKNVLGTILNALAALALAAVAFGQINWLVALLIGPGALVGGVIGADRQAPRPVGAAGVHHRHRRRRHREPAALTPP